MGFKLFYYSNSKSKYWWGVLIVQFWNHCHRLWPTPWSKSFEFQKLSWDSEYWWPIARTKSSSKEKNFLSSCASGLDSNQLLRIPWGWCILRSDDQKILNITYIGIWEESNWIIWLLKCISRSENQNSLIVVIFRWHPLKCKPGKNKTEYRGELEVN